MTSPCRLRGVLLACALVGLGPGGGSLFADPPPPAPSAGTTPGEVAGRVLEASKAGDAKALAALSESHSPPPFLVASGLWAEVLAAPDEASRRAAETALTAWGEAWRHRPIAAGLPGAVARWLAFGDDERARDRLLRALFVRLQKAEVAKDADEALRALEEAEPLIDKAPASEVAYDVLAKAGGLLASWGRSKGLPAVQRAAAHAEAMGSLFMASRCWSYIGKVHSEQGRLETALESSEHESRLCAATQDISNRANALCNQTLLLVMLERPREAVARGEQALILAREAGSVKVQARAEDMLSQVHAHLGDLVAARRAAEAAVAHALEAGDPVRSSELRFRLAQTLLEQDAWSESHEMFAVLRRHADETNDASLAWLSTAALANLGRLLGRPEEALARAQELERLAAVYPILEDRPALLADAKTSVALSHLALAQPRAGGRGAQPVDPEVLHQGVKAAREAIVIYESQGPWLTRMATTTRLALARLLVALGERKEAIAILEQVRRAPGVAGERSSAAVLLLEAQAHDHFHADRYAEAVLAASEALAVRRHLLRVLAEDDSLASREEAVVTAALVVTAAARLRATRPARNDDAVLHAFEAAEGARALLLTEGLLHGRAVLWRDLPVELVAEDEQTRAAVKAARERWFEAASPPKGEGARGAPSPEAQTAAGKALVEAWKQRDATVLKLQRAARRASAFVDPPAPDLAATRAALAADDALVLYQTVGGEAAHAVVVRRDGARLVDLGPARTIESSVSAWLRLLPAAGADDREAAAAVYERLVRPLEPALEGARRLLLVPDGVLAFVPFEAVLRPMPAGSAGPAMRDERLVERFEVAYAPSVGVLAALRGDPASAEKGRGVLALGDPDLGPAGAQFPPLPEARTEAQTLVARVPEDERTLLVGTHATAGRLLAALAPGAPRRRVVHLACHGVGNPAVPRATGLLLAGGEVLDVDRLGRERWAADLVTLAACDSGRGRVVAGEGVFGLVRAVLLTGVPRVVTSQWMVDDRATRRLMSRFYDGLLGKGLSPSRALAEAKRAALKDGGADAEPSRWAAFVLWGLPD